METWPGTIASKSPGRLVTQTESPLLLRAWVVIKKLHLPPHEMMPGWGQAIAIADFRDQGVVTEGTFFKHCLILGGRCQSSTLSSANIWECHPGCESLLCQNRGMVTLSTLGKEAGEFCFFP